MSNSLKIWVLFFVFLFGFVSFYSIGVNEKVRSSLLQIRDYDIKENKMFLEQYREHSFKENFNFGALYTEKEVNAILSENTTDINAYLALTNNKFNFLIHPLQYTELSAKLSDSMLKKVKMLLSFYKYYQPQENYKNSILK